MRWLLCWTGALVVPLVACSTECARVAEKACEATQAADFDICIKRATEKACKAEEAANFDICVKLGPRRATEKACKAEEAANFNICVRHEVSRCRGGR